MKKIGVKPKPRCLPPVYLITCSYSRILDQMKALLRQHQMEGSSEDQTLKRNVADALAAMSRIPGFQGMTKDELLALQPLNADVEEELSIAAATMAYFKVDFFVCISLCHKVDERRIHNH
eukprot:1138164-Pelagomonas_calceolata.AAC.5